MRFTPDNRLIDIMVGQLFYSTPDAAMRELLQNAEDACALQKLEHADYEPKIVVRYSKRENWVEVIDNGLGMNQETIEKSFAAVGASKDGVEHIKALLERSGVGSRQIAYFGVGILSCFGVAATMTVQTKMEDRDGVAFSINDYHADFQQLSQLPSVRGTSIRLNLKADGPMQAQHVPSAVERYARHAAHVEIEDVDEDSRRAVPEQWLCDEVSSIPVVDVGVSVGRLALQPAWDEGQGPLRSSLLLCNGGFLAQEAELHLLPTEAIGYVGEIDIRPGELTIQLNREGFVKDAKWQALGVRLVGTYNTLIRTKVTEWERMAADAARVTLLREFEGRILFLSRGPTRTVLEKDIVERLDQLLPRVFSVKERLATQPSLVTDVLVRARVRGSLFFVKEGEGPQRFEQSLRNGSGTVNVVEASQTGDLRATHLQAKGEIVVNVRQRVYPYEVAGATHKFRVDETELLRQECEKAGVRFINVTEASPEDVALGGVEESAFLSELLGFGASLKFIALDGSLDPVIRDYAGRLLNYRNPEILEVLRMLPDAAGNPVRRILLQIYMDIQSYSLEAARQRTKELLTMPDLAEQAQLSTGDLLRAMLESKIVRMLSDKHEEPPV